MTSEPLAGARIAVTGGASGIGRAAAQLLVERGAAVAILDVAGLDDAAGWHLGPVLHCDVADEAAVDGAFVAVAQHLGGLDGLVAAAGIGSGAGDCVTVPIEADRERASRQVPMLAAVWPSTTVKPA